MIRQDDNEGLAGEGEGVGALPYKNDGGARRKIFGKHPTRYQNVLFDGRGLNVFLPLSWYSSETTQAIFRYFSQGSIP